MLNRFITNKSTIDSYKEHIPLSKSCEKLKTFKLYEDDDTDHLSIESGFSIKLFECKRDSGSNLKVIRLIRTDE
jgi:hypothetical protein